MQEDEITLRDGSQDLPTGLGQLSDKATEELDGFLAGASHYIWLVLDK
jgi:X-X-X-Leu-X-X-Gly heptad repeat protein